MRRWIVISAATLFAILASTLPLVAMFAIDQDNANETLQLYVNDRASYTALRGERTLENAKQALVRAQAIDGADCSSEHMGQMGQVAVDAHSIEDVGYFRSGQLVCTRLGVISPPARAHAGDLDLGDEYSLHFAEQPILFKGKPRIELRRGDYGVLIMPGRFTDLVGHPDTTLGLATNQGHVLEVSGSADSQIIKALISGEPFVTSSRYVYATHAVNDDLVAFALIDREHARYKTSVDWRYILLVGGGISFTLIGFIVWVSRLQLSPAKTLEQAIRNREFVVHYQPIIELSTRRCIAAEALVRWQQQGGRLVPPDQFIPLAEASGLISSLTNLVVETVTSEMGTLLRSKSDLHVSINISVHDIESAQFLLGLTAATAKAGIDPSQIWLEVTERSFMNVPAARRTIAAARDAGFRIAVDDFGTGYSSLALLDGLPLDALKIDKSFVDAIGHDAAQNIVTRHIIGMAHELKLAMIAEGVETREQETYLKNAGVQFGQGWLYAKALPAEQFIALLTCSPSDEGLDNHGNLRVLEHEA